jgi:two-component system OmpR family response regulator
MSNKHKKIFIVDDDEMLTMMLEDHLSKNSQYSIQSFGTGEECLTQLEQNPDVVILDFNLDSVEPDAKNGLEILKQIKKGHRGVQVIMYSSQKQYGKALQTIGEGAVEYIIKDKDAFSKIERILKGL